MNTLRFVITPPTKPGGTSTSLSAPPASTTPDWGWSLLTSTHSPCAVKAPTGRRKRAWNGTCVPGVKPRSVSRKQAVAEPTLS
ncbi:hypothetical protein [Corallococcus sp. NCRR]|uniref:hypothetical protein n=1 Tax=Corallococcus sp. NCRR TaxID=2996782 RepID=UPI0022A99C9C|nr:hypothetical protein [Corallococcus sp. NCRR]WAS86832.1 hypothetical protein O0N60_07615 [Corallococcus sp. NCRR]